MPRQSLLVKLFHERIGIEFLHVPYARFLPQAFEEHHGANHGGNAGCVAHALHACFLVSFLVAAIVVYIIGVFLAVLQTADTATDGGFAFVILA